MTKIPPAPTWDLDSIFPGGSSSPQFAQFRAKTKEELAQATKLLSVLPATLSDATASQWREFVLALQSTCENIELVRSFSNMLVSANVKDDKAEAIVGEGDEFFSQWEKLRTDFEAMALKQDDAAWEKLVSSRELAAVKFFLDEMRGLAKRKMSPEMEALALELAVNGYHSWNRLYDRMSGELMVDFEDNGTSAELSLGQLATKMSDRRREIREQAFRKMTEAWKSRADLAAMALNAQAGFRLSLYNRRGWTSPLYEPLTLARLKEETLDTMWRVISRETAKLKPYIDAKSKLLGIDKFSWWDEFAPCGAVEKTYTFDEAGEFIIEQTASVSRHLSDFCRMALEKRWVEAEDRPGKRGGGYCTGTGPIRQSRIFMTYAGTYENLSTLAHELGHAYHSHVLKDHPYFATWYPMTLAETASIFTETLVVEAAMAQSTDREERLMLLDQKLQNAYIMFTDIHSRFLFDKSFYAERKNGIVQKDRLSELMIEAQRKAFAGLLDESGYHPYFWASKLHFFITDTPFYNFPYTFGYLFAGGVYDRAKTEGKAFADKYRALLADTGSMTTEECAMKHLGVDLTKDDFWVAAVKRSIADVDEFVKLASHK